MVHVGVSEYDLLDVILIVWRIEVARAAVSFVRAFCPPVRRRTIRLTTQGWLCRISCRSAADLSAALINQDHS